ncbi:3-isopropylmalate dehydratase small subunit [Sphingomonas sp.]|jgi:3-isopropylmalate dehydratase small subunit|uniref:3-isopropylmalate dehydratase small subunit n=1 Tax=Sphingomonas sp. TaxID=28214 RepID=UPI002D7F86C3|nr:3-isopropylmalate dehydratase small subunit [Sphingomonas sp.]HEU0043441.1 3-isopropylmalate dehydratase small subunit [Sphingomonas sp.]
MIPFTTLTSVAAPLPQDDIDTDIIYPARFLLITDRNGLDRYGFHDWRFDAKGCAKPGFPLAEPRWERARILVTGTNFGCGSSREHAPWALAALGIRVILAPSFGEIFYNNCFKNGLLPIVVAAGDHAALLEDAMSARSMTVDLVAGEVRRADGGVVPFSVDPDRRAALLNGWDEIDMIVARHLADIEAFEGQQRRSQPWLWEGEETHAA